MILYFPLAFVKDGLPFAVAIGFLCGKGFASWSMLMANEVLAPEYSIGSGLRLWLLSSRSVKPQSCKKKGQSRLHCTSQEH